MPETRSLDLLNHTVTPDSSGLVIPRPTTGKLANNIHKRTWWEILPPNGALRSFSLDFEVPAWFSTNGKLFGVCTSDVATGSRFRLSAQSNAIAGDNVESLDPGSFGATAALNLSPPSAVWRRRTFEMSLPVAGASKTISLTFGRDGAAISPNNDDVAGSLYIVSLQFLGDTA